MRILRQIGALSASSVLVGALGCTAAVVDPAPEGGPTVTTQALVRMDRSEREGKPVRTYFSAKFLRVPLASDSEDVERVVGSELDLPGVGECMTVSADAAPGADFNVTGPVELFDVGDVTIKTPSDSIPLAARAFPDVGDRVSGVFYTSPDAASDLPAPGKYVLQTSGSSSVARFAVESEAPPQLAEVTVSGHALAEGIELSDAAPIDLRWRESGAKDDLVYVEIVAENGVAARCAFEDRGAGSVPGSLLRTAGFGEMPVVATLAVHRVRQGSFHVPGVDTGEVRFDVSVVAGVTLVTREAREPRSVTQRAAIVPAHDAPSSR